MSTIIDSLQSLRQCARMTDDEAGLGFLSDFLLYALIVVAVAPIALVGILALAHYFEWQAFDRILEATRLALTTQWRVGGLVNTLLGLALLAAAIWLAWRSHTISSWVGVATMLLIGLWRLTRGVSVLRAFRD